MIHNPQLVRGLRKRKDGAHSLFGPDVVAASNLSIKYFYRQENYHRSIRSPLPDNGSQLMRNKGKNIADSSDTLRESILSNADISEARERREKD